jgi:hypothetical protein
MARIASNKLDSPPLTRFFGDRNAGIVVGPVPNGTVCTGRGEGCQISGRMVLTSLRQFVVATRGLLLRLERIEPRC